MPEVDELIDAARAYPVGVIGGGIGGLIAAWECAKVGMPVTLWEQNDTVGGTIRTATVGGELVDVGADSISQRDESVRAVLAEFALQDKLAEPLTTRRHLDGKKLVPLPESPALGIPANPFTADVVAVIGWRGAWRAYLDRLKPVLTIGREENLGNLVTRRMGHTVTERLVAPVTRATLHLEPGQVRIDSAIPELNNAFTRAGSLSGGVAQLDPHTPAPTLKGGLSQFTEALRERIIELGGSVIAGSRVASVEQSADGWTITPAEGEPMSVAHLIMATNETSAHELLAESALPTPAAKPLTVVTLAVDAPITLDAGTYAASAGAVTVLDDQTARWGGGGTHVLRLQLTDPTQSDADALATARTELARLLGEEAPIVDSRVDRFELAQNGAAIGFEERITRIRAAIAKHPRLDVVGAWVAGSGVSAVVADALVTAEEIRRTALFAE